MEKQKRVKLGRGLQSLLGDLEESSPETLAADSWAANQSATNPSVTNPSATEPSAIQPSAAAPTQPEPSASQAIHAAAPVKASVHNPSAPTPPTAATPKSSPVAPAPTAHAPPAATTKPQPEPVRASVTVKPEPEAALAKSAEPSKPSVKAASPKPETNPAAAHQAARPGGRADKTKDEATPLGDVRRLELAKIDPNPFQPRRDFNPEELAELTQSIIQHGVLQPILVRPVGDRFQLIAGERRLRAAQDAGLVLIPAAILEVGDQETYEFALIENLQRKDLNPLEKAQAFYDYLKRYDSTHEELASQLGVDRSTVTNLIRLLELPEAVQESLRIERISNGHARALLGLNDSAAQVALCRRILTEGLSVRQVEALVKEQKGTDKPRESTAKENKSSHLVSLEGELRQRFGTKVEISPKKQDQGIIKIHFLSHEEFERVVEALIGKNFAA